MATTETHSFQAESKALLDLMIHSLYTSKEIFLRELISNASDALDRLRFEALTQPELMSDGSALEIRLVADPAERTLTVRDTGIGMSRDELIRNIGTIARSGTKELRQKVMESGTPEAFAELIGQFGVGFYSAFLVADKVTLVTRRAGEAASTRWESTGDGTYSITEEEGGARGTAITLHLKPVDRENGIDDYTQRWQVSSLVKRYSDFINYPILFEEKGKDADNTALNSQKPLWTRTAAEVTEEEYNEFYKHLSHDFEPPLKSLPFRAEGVQEYQALLFLPAKAAHDLYYHGFESGLRLYARRVLIMEQCPELLPAYLRFVKGVVDASGLPLNISRQHLQQDRHVTQIRKWLTRKMLDTLATIQSKEPEVYKTFWDEFGRAVKEGVPSDYENQQKLLPLLMFASSHDEKGVVTLQQYVDRMPADQSEIYYLTGESRAAIQNSPHLEAVFSKGYEVLYLTDPVDEFVAQSVPEFAGKKLKSVGKGTVQVGTEEERAKADEDLKSRSVEFTPLLDFLQKELDADVKQVRLSSRLTKSPACLVVEDYEQSPHLEKLMMRAKGSGERQKRVMELNAEHPVIQRLRERLSQNPDDAMLGSSAQFLLGISLLAEGSELPDPARFTQAAAGMLEKAL